MLGRFCLILHFTTSEMFPPELFTYKRAEKDTHAFMLMSKDGSVPPKTKTKNIYSNEYEGLKKDDLRI